MSESVRVGFVGLGHMGWPMARNLAQAGLRPVVRDADPDRQASFVEQFEAVSASAPADFADVDVVVTMLPDDTVVRSAILDWDGGIAGVLASGAVVLDMSSSNPRGTLELGATLAEKGITLLDGPVSGAVAGAEAGTLTIMLGGDDPAAIENAMPVLDVLGDPERLFRTGPLGSGHAMKALNNFAAASAYVATAEAVAIGLEFGLDPETMIDIFNVSTGRSFQTQLVFKEHILRGQYGTGFAMGLLAKDVGIAADLAESKSVDAPALEVVNRRWSQAKDALGGADDHSRAHTTWWPADFSARGAKVPTGD